MKVTVREEKVMIPTYEIAQYDKNPMFLDKRVYQGSSGKVYPHPVCENVKDEKTEKWYDAIFLENDYLLVMILPELGGRIQRLYDKTNHYDAVYYNEVIKPALVGLAGPWISGGIEFNWPQHHRPSTFDPVDYTIEKKEDGSAIVWVGETEKMFHTKGMAGFCMYPDKAYLEIRGQLYNPTEIPQTFLWWANPAVSVNDDTQSVFPPDVTAVMDHGKRDVSKFPIADGVYYKVDYAPGTDISRYKNIPVPTSYMAHHSDYDFIGNYDHGKQAGLLHIADHHICPGKKQWTWGNGDFGKAWDRNLTDENGPYIELMTGVFTDNQPDFTYIKPYEEKSFVQYFLPYKNAGAIKNASTELLMNLEKEEESVKIALYAPCMQENLKISLLYEEDEIFMDMTDLSPVKSYEKTLQISKDMDEEKLSLIVYKEGRELLSYQAKKVPDMMPEKAVALPKPEEIETTEKLFLAATHLEQYRHATYSPEDYYLEGLKRDASDIRLNLGYGKYLYQKGEYKEAKPYVKAAIKSLTWKNPNPYDCEAFYVLGLLEEKLGYESEAFDAYYKAAWDQAMQNKAFYRLACMAAKKEKWEQALFFVQKSLERGTHHLKARTLKAALLRKTGKREKAEDFVKESMLIDSLDQGARYEAFLLKLISQKDFYKVMRDEEHNFIELALTYREAGLIEEAKDILLLSYHMTPMSGYYLYAITGEKSYLERAEKTDSDYCFPNRLTDMEVLEKAEEAGAFYAAYYLGNLYYDRKRVEDACREWESCKDKIEIPTAYRNLAFIYFNDFHDAEKARLYMEKAFSMNTADVRVLFELDQLYKVTGENMAFRLKNLRNYEKLLEKRDDLYTEYISLLNMNGEYEKAYGCIMKHHFHPWEGGEGKISYQYRYALMHMAYTKSDIEKEKLYKQALTYPDSLGEGKLVGNLDNDIYYLLGKNEKNKEKAREYFELAARGDSDLNSATYYNDQPPQMKFYAALAKKELGNDVEKEFQHFISYGKEHFEDAVAIDFFAVSLPDFLVFHADLEKNNKVHCLFMEALGNAGLGNKDKAKKAIEEGLKLAPCHQELLNLAKLYACFA